MCIRSNDRPRSAWASRWLLLFPLLFAGGVFVSLSASASAAHRQAGAHRDRMHPSGILGAAFEAVAVEKQPHEDLLGRVVGVLLVAEQAVADSPHALAESLHQRHERRSVGALAGRFVGQLLVGTFGDFQPQIPRSKHGTHASRIPARPPLDWLPAGEGSVTKSVRLKAFCRSEICRKTGLFRRFRLNRTTCPFYRQDQCGGPAAAAMAWFETQNAHSTRCADNAPPNQAGGRRAGRLSRTLASSL